MRFTDKVAIVTGGARGIGLACVRRLVDEGAKVVFGDLRIDEGVAAAKEVRKAGGSAVFVRCDVTSTRSIQALIEKAVKTYGGIDTGIHVAAIWHKKDFLDESEANFDRIIRVNLKGTFLFGQTLARYFVQNGRQGSIVNFSSIAAHLADGSQSAYVTSKAAVGGLTRAMAMSLATHGIRVNAIGPGPTVTPMAGDLLQADLRDMMLSRTPLGRYADPSEQASAAVFLASDDASFFTGQTLFPDGGRLTLNYTVPVRAGAVHDAQ